MDKKGIAPGMKLELTGRMELQQKLVMTPCVVESIDDVYENVAKWSGAKGLPDGLTEYVEAVIESEDCDVPYTDQQIAESSVSYGFDGLTRRDVSKVRFELGILPSIQRGLNK